MSTGMVLWLAPLPMPCPFCSPTATLQAENASAIALLDSFPVSQGQVSLDYPDRPN